MKITDKLYLTFSGIRYGGAANPIKDRDTATGEVMRDDNGWYSDKRLKNILDADVSVSGSLSRLKSLNTVKFKYDDIYWNRYKENTVIHGVYKIKEDRRILWIYSR